MRSIWRSVWVRRALAACALALVASTAAAVESPTLFSRVSVFNSDGFSSIDTGTREASATLSRIGLFGTGRATADYGTWSLNLLATAAPTQTTTAVAVIGESSMTDTLTITPQVPGSLVAGTFTAALTMTGDEAFPTEFLSTGPGLPFLSRQLHVGTTQIVVPFIVGSPFDIGVALRDDTGSVQSPTRPIGSSNVHIRWEGISRVEVGGNDVPYTLTSLSGTNWAMAAPIPEPPIGVLLAVALGALALRRGTQRGS